MAEGGHAMIRLQLREFAAAVELASALNRTLILPQLTCGDRVSHLLIRSHGNRSNVRLTPWAL